MILFIVKLSLSLLQFIKFIILLLYIEAPHQPVAANAILSPSNFVIINLLKQIKD